MEMVSANLVNKADSRVVPGIIRLAADHDLLEWTRWRYHSDDADAVWDWWGIFLDCQSSDGRQECYAAVVADKLYGLMALNLEEIAAQGLIVDYLTTHPANRADHAGLKHIGTALLGVAVMRSEETGAEGRIHLESLPAAQAFYEQLGMSKQPERSKEGHVIYELEPEAAKQLLEKIKEKRILEI